MMRRLALTLFLGFSGLLVVCPAAVRAEVSGSVKQLADVLQIGETVSVLRDEGLANANGIATGLPGGATDPSWRRNIDRIYDLAAMEAGFDQAMEQELTNAPDVVTEATRFFSSDLGARALKLEIEARRAMADPDREAAARLAYEQLEHENPARRALIDRFVAVNDLIESNVMGSLNANLAFYRGLAAEGGKGFEMTEAEMLDKVWAEEPQAREEAAGWLFPFLTLAYQPLSDEELQAYIDFSSTAAGRRINAAMFAAFDSMFARISEDLGRAVARQMQGQDI